MAQSKWDHKHDREGYRATPTEEEVLSPMLAKTFDRGRHLDYPLYAQPKIDGLRCLARWDGGGVRLLSRTGCPFQGLGPVREELAPYLRENPTLVLDGELYSDEMPFEELSGLCRRQTAATDGHDQKVVYHVFDAITTPPMAFHERLHRLPPESGHIRRVPTCEVPGPTGIEPQLRKFVGQGYEGIILRNRDGLYRKGHRSWDLQKYKLFQEEEFPITGFTEGTGREKGLVVWECQTAGGRSFHVRPRGDHAVRRRLFQEAASCVGKKLTVVFQEYTKDGVPRFPVAKDIREDY
jgi:ATP-dependent DNA ligase